MSARTWALGFVCAFFGILAGGAAGCSSKPRSGVGSTADASTDNQEVEPNDAAASSAGAGGSAGTDIAADAGTPKDAHGGCNPSSVDDPDDNFSDTNCDGIDGDKSAAIFVAITGNDSTDGSMAHPVATITHGIELAIASSKDVYVCKGNYAENTIQLASHAVRVYGGYDCTANWVRNAESKAHLNSLATTAVSIKGVSGAVVFDSINVKSANATTASDGSIAVFVSNSNDVTLRQAAFQAGSGADASAPAAPAPAVNSQPVCFPGMYLSGCFGEPGQDVYQKANCFYNNQPGDAYFINNAPFTDKTVFVTAAASGISAKNQCKNSQVTYGGSGGGTDPTNPKLGTDGTAGAPPSTTGTLDGADGTTPQPGSAATQGYGSLNENGYVPSNHGNVGANGTAGESGTGGNGGGFFTIVSGGTGDFPYYLYAPRAGGGKGGFGGCGGDGGPGGNAGGASIAVASYQSTAVIEYATLISSNGGKGSAGAAGGDGADGQSGGPGGTAYYQCAKCVSGEETVCASVKMTNSTTAKSGGKGGKGGKGSQGGPGAGGPSIALVVSGNEPKLSGTTLLPGTGGLGGCNGGPRAADGESTDEKVLP